jgi:hypothetical protein
LLWQVHESFEYTLEEKLKRLVESRLALFGITALFWVAVTGIQTGRTNAAFATRTQLWQV